MRPRLVIGLILATLASWSCKGKESGDSSEQQKPQGDTPAPATEQPETKPETAASDEPADKPADDDMCKDPCRLLSKHKLVDIETGLLKTQCGSEELYPLNDCQAIDRMRNCIYAVHGYKFKKKKWQKEFGNKSWYQPRDDFKDSELSKTEVANVRQLKYRARDCLSGQLVQVDQKDSRLVEAWFKKKQSGKPEIPAVVLMDGQKSTEQEVRSFINTKGLFVLKRHTPMGYMEESAGASEVSGKNTRTISVGTGVPSPDCQSKGDSEECEGFEWIEMTFDDKDKLVAINVSAAACPFVYASSGTGPLVFEGEILRNLGRPRLEATQSLELGSIEACRGAIRVRLSEEKPEVSYIDSVSLVVGGRALRPNECGRDARFCADDSRYHTLSIGQTLDLSFDVPEGIDCADPVLKVDGYYVPAP